MTAFHACKQIEAEALDRLKPYLKEVSDGRFVVTNKGKLAPFLQEVCGDVLLNTPNETLYALELKAERNYSPNLFLETWSNKNLDRREDHAKRGSNRGWLEKSHADFLFYYFMPTDDLWIVDMFRLQQWAFGTKQTPPNLVRADMHGNAEFPEKLQSRYSQANDTWGRCVPTRTLVREVRAKLIHPRQLELFAA